MTIPTDDSFILQLDLAQFGRVVPCALQLSTTTQAFDFDFDWGNESDLAAL